MGRHLANDRAAFAYETVAEISNSATDQSPFSKYRSLVRSFPAMILANGYGTAMAFLYSKRNAENEHKKLYGQIEDWLFKQGLLPAEYKDKDGDEGKNKNMIQYIVQQKSDGYRLLGDETIALLNWLKRFAEGMAKG